MNNSSNAERLDLRSMTLDEMKELTVNMGESAYRADQLFLHISRGVSNIEEIKQLPVSFRKELAKLAYIVTPTIHTVRKSKDGTIKILVRLHDGIMVESVLMHYRHGYSICISCQAGCRMGCSFCASTKKGLARNLSAGEMISQILLLEQLGNCHMSNLVLMGMGEPMDNFENVCNLIDILSDAKGRKLSRRNITISTCGIVPKIRELAERFPQVNLAISLHAPDDERRSMLMPINKKYSISEVMKAVKEHAAKTGRRPTFEYTMVSGENDSEKDAHKLGQLLNKMNAHVNLIPLHIIEGGKSLPTKKNDIIRFQNILNKYGITVTIRRSLGQDIDGACGQLKLSVKI